MPKKEPRKLNDELNKKLPPLKQLSLAATDEDIKAHIKEIRRLQSQTIDKLFAFYGIKKDLVFCWQKLAWRLAEDFVPAIHAISLRGSSAKP